MSWLKKQFKKLKNRVTTKPWDRLKVSPMDRLTGDWTAGSSNGNSKPGFNYLNYLTKQVGLPQRGTANITGYNPTTGWGGGNTDWTRPTPGLGIQAIDPSQTSSYGNTRVGGTMSTPSTSLSGVLQAPGYQDVTAQTTMDANNQAFQWQDMNMDHVYNPEEEYDPRSSVWNGWMNQQDAVQNPTDSVSGGMFGRTPTQGQQNLINAQTYANWSGNPLQGQQLADLQAAASEPKHNWKTEKAAGNDWLGDMF